MTIYPGGPQDGIVYEAIAPDGAGALNLLPTPSFEVDLGLWSHEANGTLNDRSRSTVWSKVGVASQHFKITGTGANQHAFLCYPSSASAGTSGPPVTAGVTYTFRAFMNVISKGATLPRMQIDWYNAGGGVISSSLANFPNSLGEITGKVTGVAPVGAVRVQLIAGQAGSLNNAEVFEMYFDAASLVAEATSSTYFDGDTPGSSWTGAPGNSTSRRGSRAAFNDDTDPDSVGVAWFSGLDSPEIREAIDPRAGTDGGVQGTNFRGSRPVVGTTQILGATNTERNTKFQRLKRAMNALAADGALNFTPEGGLPSVAYFRLNGPIRRSDERGRLYTVQFPLMAADPYIYGQLLRSSTLGTAGGGAQTIINQGDGRSAPIIDVTLGSASAVLISNNTTGQAVRVNSVDPANVVSWVSKFGSPGTGNSSFSSPQGVATDAAGNVYVADFNNHRVKKFNSAGVFQLAIGTGPGSADGALNGPTDVAVDAAGNIYVSEYYNSRVQKFNSAGVFQAKTTTACVGAYSVAVDATPNVFVACGGEQTVRKFANTLGAQTANFGSNGSGNGQFNGAGSPSGVAVDSANQPWVTDPTGGRIQKFTNAATPVYSAQYSTAALANMPTPVGIAIGASDIVYVGDYTRNVVGKFSAAGAFLTTIGSYGTGDGQFSNVGGIDARGSVLWVGDSIANRIQQFSVAATGNVIETNHALAALTTNTGLNLYSFIDVPNTNWWSLAAGDNVISVTGPGVTSWTIKWRDAWL